MVRPNKQRAYEKKKKKKKATDGEKMVNKYKNILDIVKALYYIIKDIIL